MKTCNFSNAKIGDKVWDFMYGHGTIVDIKETTEYLLTVDFTTRQSFETYTLLGANTAEEAPTLFWQPFEIPDVAFEKPLPKLEVDTKVLVWIDGKTTKYKRLKKLKAGDEVRTSQLLVLRVRNNYPLGYELIDDTDTVHQYKDILECKFNNIHDDTGDFTKVVSKGTDILLGDYIAKEVTYPFKARNTVELKLIEEK